MVFFAGLPGTGKSLLVHQLTHLAASAGRSVHLLQWDVARPAFEASAAGRRYPLADGVTHPVIRKAAGLWARRALVAWDERHPDPRHLLVGETPFVGNRFVELARRLDDAAEALLTAPSCRFAIAVPSREVRRFLEAERERRAASPLHPREREDAPPHVLRDLWRDLHDVARGLGIATPEPRADAGDRTAQTDHRTIPPCTSASTRRCSGIDTSQALALSTDPAHRDSSRSTTSPSPRPTWRRPRRRPTRSSAMSSAATPTRPPCSARSPAGTTAADVGQERPARAGGSLPRRGAGAPATRS